MSKVFVLYDGDIDRDPYCHPKVLGIYSSLEIAQASPPESFSWASWGAPMVGKSAVSVYQDNDSDNPIIYNSIVEMELQTIPTKKEPANV